MSTIQIVAKEIVDRTAAIVLIALSAPLLLFAALVIKLCSRGPTLYTQQRIGRGGRPFSIYKFRTMHVQGSSEPGSTVTKQGDARIFRGGGFLRKWKIDELPQLFNVLNGTMSMVGPRPTTANDFQRMNGEQRRRCIVKPGITGLAQINGGAAIAWPRRIEYDLDYIANYRLGNDLRIVMVTAWLLLTGRADATAGTDDEWSEAVSSSTSPFAKWPVFDDPQIDAVTQVLKSGQVNYWTGGEGRRFEEEFADFSNCRHAIALANGTVALELAWHALGVGPGDEVIVPSRTFIASAGSVVACGAQPVIADVDPDSQNLTRETVEAVLTSRTKAIVAVHLAGWPCDMDSIMDLARSRGIVVVEDCAQAHGAQYKGRPVGSIGDAGAFSFCNDKIISTGGEGGMLVTSDTKLWDKAWRYKDHGKPPEAFFNRQPPSTEYRWLHEGFGTNWRMTEMQAAIGRVSLRSLPAWIETRQRHALKLADVCRSFPSLRTPLPPSHVRHAYYKFYTFVEPEFLAPDWNRDRLLKQLQSDGIPCFSGSCSEIYREKAFPPSWRPRQRLPNARQLGDSSIMFLVHPTLTERNIEDTCRAICRVMRGAADPDARRSAA